MSLQVMSMHREVQIKKLVEVQVRQRLFLARRSSVWVGQVHN